MDKEEQIEWDVILGYEGDSDDKRERAVYRSRNIRRAFYADIRIEVTLHGMSGTCTKCGETKPASQFGLLTDDNLKARDGVITVRNQPQCKACRR